SFTPVMHADGSVTGVIVSVVDVTERRALLEAERDARVRADFLARAGAILDASLDYEEKLRSVAQIAIREVTDEMLAAAVEDPEHLELIRRLGLRSVIIAALKARGRVFGTFSLASAESGRLFDDADLQLAEELA